MKTYQLIALLFSFLVSNAYAGVKIGKVEFKKTKNSGLITVHYTGSMKDYPELSVSGKSIQVTIPNSKVKRNTEMSVSFSSALKDTQIRAYQMTNKDSKIKAFLPFLVKPKESQIALTIKENRIELSFPRVLVNLKKAPKYGSMLKKKKKKVKKEFLNEAYLNKLLKVEKKTIAGKVIKPTKKAVEKFKRNVKSTSIKAIASDSIKTTMASPERVAAKKTNQFSILEYGGKFVAFLGLVLLLFYGVITLLKKGFINKGKLGFLNNADQVSVISTTHIAPKKSLMLIKAHNQVFLISNTDQGIHAISEIKDAAGLLKEGEKTISGHNFDTNLGLAQANPTNDKKIKIKEDITQSNKVSSLSSYENVEEKVKFSDTLKKKVKSLKPLQ